jgi:hypothetical protein
VHAAIQTVAPPVLGAASGTSLLAANGAGAHREVHAAIQTVPPPELSAASGRKLRAANGAGAHREVYAAFKTVAPDVLANFKEHTLRAFFASDQSKSSSVLSYLVWTAADQVSGRVDSICAYSPLILT